MKKKKFKVWHAYGITNFEIKANETIYRIKKDKNSFYNKMKENNKYAFKNDYPEELDFYKDKKGIFIKYTP